MLRRVLQHNKKFVEQRKDQGDNQWISGHAQKEVMIFTCMDTRLVDLVEPAMGFKRGDIKILKNAGNTIRENCDEIIRCISLGAITMGIKEVFVVGHKDCGMCKLTEGELREKMLSRGISEEVIRGVNLKEWAGLVTDEAENIKKTVDKIHDSPFIPKDVIVHGLIMDPYSAMLEVIVDGNQGNPSVHIVPMGA